MSGGWASYRMRAGYRAKMLFVFVVMAVFGVFFADAVLSRSTGPPVWFLAVWFGGLVWNGYWLLLRVSYRVDLDGSVLRWWTPLRRGELALADLRAVRPSRVAFNIVVLVPTVGPAVPVQIRRGFVGFAEAVEAAAPYAEVRVPLYARVVERLPGRSGFVITGP